MIAGGSPSAFIALANERFFFRTTFRMAFFNTLQLGSI